MFSWQFPDGLSGDNYLVRSDDNYLGWLSDEFFRLINSADIEIMAMMV